MFLRWFRSFFLISSISSFRLRWSVSISPQVDVAICDFKISNSAGANWNMNHSGKRFGNLQLESVKHSYEICTITCWALISLFTELLHFQFLHCPDFVFGSAKKALENRQSLLQFLVCGVDCANCKCAWLCALLFQLFHL